MFASQIIEKLSDTMEKQKQIIAEQQDLIERLQRQLQQKEQQSGL